MNVLFFQSCKTWNLFADFQAKQRCCYNPTFSCSSFILKDQTPEFADCRAETENYLCVMKLNPWANHRAEKIISKAHSGRLEQLHSE